MYQTTTTQKPSIMKFSEKCKLALTMGNLLRSKKYGGYSPSIAMNLAWDYVKQIERLHISAFIIKFYSDSADGELVTKVVKILPTENGTLQNYIDLVREFKGEHSFRRYKLSSRVFEKVA